MISLIKVQIDSLELTLINCRIDNLLFHFNALPSARKGKFIQQLLLCLSLVVLFIFYYYSSHLNKFATAPPRIRLEPQRQVVRPGDQVDIRCEASGDQPITINWFKMDGVLPPAVLVNNGQLQVELINLAEINFDLNSPSFLP